MPIFFSQRVDDYAELAVWKIEEEESFFTGEAIAARPIHHPQKRLQHLAGRWLLKFLMPQLDVSKINSEPNEKPFLPGLPIFFSISHSGAFVAVLISKKASVGLDVECFNPKILAITQKFLTVEEQSLILKTTEKGGLKPNFKKELVMETLIWSAKESIYKQGKYGKVNFKQNLNVFEINHYTNTIVCKHNLYDEPIELQYLIFENFVLTWAIA